jgi:hypothetical protein
MVSPLQILAELNAEAFLHAYQRCIKPLDHLLGVPAIVCAAFAAELGLKAILQRRGLSNERGHNLQALLERLPADDRDAIVSETSKSFADFSTLLRQVADAFVDWRYIYESKGPKEGNLFFIGAFAGAIVRHLAAIRAGDTV